jgi:hypothetical protein
MAPNLAPTTTAVCGHNSPWALAITRRNAVARLVRGLGPAVTARAGQLRITQVTVGGALPAEGALSYIPVERANGATVTERQLQGRGRLTLGGRLKTGGRGR